MRINLLYKNGGSDLYNTFKEEHHATLKEDLSMESVLQSMSKGDAFLYNVCDRLLFEEPLDQDDIKFRQDIMKDCLAHPTVIKDFYELACSAVEINKFKYIGVLSKAPEYVLLGYIRVLEEEEELLKKLYQLADESMSLWHSEGLKSVCETILEELSPDYIAQLEEYIKILQFPHGISVNISLGSYLKPCDFVFQMPPGKEKVIRNLIQHRKKELRSVLIPEQDEKGYKALSHMKQESLKEIVPIIGKAVDDIKQFFLHLKGELAFYLGGVNLRDALNEGGYPITFPEILDDMPDDLLDDMPPDLLDDMLGENRDKNTNHRITMICDCSKEWDRLETNRSFLSNGNMGIKTRKLTNITLALAGRYPAVGNDIETGSHIIVTGANQGGKTTFLRSLGQALLMMNCGLFVCAESFCAPVGPIFTHFRREEDIGLVHGKLDEELERLTRIITQVRPGAWILMNESLASTNENEGSEILLQIIRAFYDKKVRLLCVTHFYQLANMLLKDGERDFDFLQAETKGDGRRTFRMREGVPLENTVGTGIYESVFGK